MIVDENVYVFMILLSVIIYQVKRVHSKRQIWWYRWLVLLLLIIVNIIWSIVIYKTKQENAYQILGISRESTQQVIHGLRDTLFEENMSGEEIRRRKVAYQVLENKTTREIYDYYNVLITVEDVYIQNFKEIPERNNILAQDAQYYLIWMIICLAATQKNNQLRGGGLISLLLCLGLFSVETDLLTNKNSFQEIRQNPFFTIYEVKQFFKNVIFQIFVSIITVYPLFFKDTKTQLKDNIDGILTNNKKYDLKNSDIVQQALDFINDEAKLQELENKQEEDKTNKILKYVSLALVAANFLSANLLDKNTQKK